MNANGSYVIQPVEGFRDSCLVSHNLWNLDILLTFKHELQGHVEYPCERVDGQSAVSDHVAGLQTEALLNILAQILLLVILKWSKAVV